MHCFSSLHYVIACSAAELKASACRDTDFLGTAMGLLESALSLGWVIGPVTGGFAADIGGFGLPFFLSGGAALVFCPILCWLLPAGQSSYYPLIMIIRMSFVVAIQIHWELRAATPT